MKTRISSVIVVVFASFAFASVCSATESSPEEPDLNALYLQIFSPAKTPVPAEPIPMAATQAYCCTEHCGCFRTDNTTCQLSGGIGYSTEEYCAKNCPYCPDPCPTCPR